MAPFKSSLARSASKLLGVFSKPDLSLRGRAYNSKVADPPMFYEFKVWGAGGAGGQPGESGGGGAYITGQYEFNPGTTLTIVVGSGGLFPVSLNVANYGGGGPKGDRFSYTTGTGGGMSGVFLTSDTVFTSADSPTPAGAIASRPSAAPNVQPGATIQNCLIAAAGGGGSVNYENGYGGGGGVTAGGNSANTDPATGGTWGGAGTDTGSGGTSDPHPDAVNGGLFYGGRSTGGGGGGGGFYGGGGGGNSSQVSGGAGGASYYKTTQPSPPAFVGYNPGSFSNSTDGIPGDDGSYPTTHGRAGNRTDPLNGGSYGAGGTNGNAGQNGLVAYRKAFSYPTLPGASWTSITHTGTDQTLIVNAD